VVRFFFVKLELRELTRFLSNTYETVHPPSSFVSTSSVSLTEAYVETDAARPSLESRSAGQTVSPD
jgi:hypothetical protein